MANHLDQFPILQAIQGIEMEHKMDQQCVISHSLVSNASYSSSMSNDVNNSQTSNHINHNHYQYQYYSQSQQQQPIIMQQQQSVSSANQASFKRSGNTTRYYNVNNNNINIDNQYLIDQFEINPLFKIEPFCPPLRHHPSPKKPSLREHIFISKDCTKRLADYIVNENWGCNEYGLLYKYLDYIFRCQLFKKQVIQIDNQYLMFHTGLQRRSDSEFLYALLIPNKKYVAQKWRVGFGNIKQSFLSKRELLYKLRYLLQRKCDSVTISRSGSKSSLLNNESDNNGEYQQQQQISSGISSSASAISASSNNSTASNSYLYETDNSDFLLSKVIPKRTKFHESLGDFLFDDSYQIEVNWEERIITNKDRICKVLGVTEFTEKWKLRQLMHLFDRALEKTKKTLSLNPRLAVAQGFVDTKHCKYRMELLLPLTIEYPKFSNKFYTFALAISRSTDQTETYTAKSILTLDMAYANARLVSYVDSSWLLPPQQLSPPQITSSYPSFSANNNYVLY